MAIGEHSVARRTSLSVHLCLDGRAPHTPALAPRPHLHGDICHSWGRAPCTGSQVHSTCPTSRRWFGSPRILRESPLLGRVRCKFAWMRNLAYSFGVSLTASEAGIICGSRTILASGSLREGNSPPNLSPPLTAAAEGVGTVAPAFI